MVARTIIENRRRLQALLQQVRRESGLTQAEVAARLNQRQSYVSKYELGEHRLDLPQLDQVCDAIGIPLDELIRRYKESAQEE